MGVLLAGLAVVPAVAVAGTAVSIEGTRFLIDGQVTYRGAPAEGLLLNSRMVQALFDDDNPATAGLWRYPDTGRWQAERNTDEFIAALPAYAAHGLRALTLSLQGGMPQPDAGFQSWEVSAFRSDGSLKAAWLARLDRALKACEANGIVVIVTLFYFGQDYRLQNEAAILTATDRLTDWLSQRGSPNVLLEINNESSDSGYSHPILRPARVHELLARVRMRSGGRLPVSTSFAPGVPGGTVPPEAVIANSDYVLVHGNGLNPSGIRNLAEQVRRSPAYQTAPKPIVFNEDSTELANLDAAISAGTSWGYYDQGRNNYHDGYQSPPINWTINTPQKHAFFQRTLTLAGGPNPPPTPPAADPARILVSSSPDRSDARALAGEILDTVYVYVDAPGIVAARFYVDDPTAGGEPTHVETVAPYDFAGGSAELANPYPAAAFGPGRHTITVALELADGGRRLETAAFTVVEPTSGLGRQDLNQGA